MKKWTVVLLTFVIVSLVSENAEARKRWFGRRRVRTTYTYTNNSNNVGVEWNGAVAIREDDQAACQREAEYMAQHGIRGHVFGVVGRFEGCGWGVFGRFRCATCRPSWNATLTGDAEVTSSWGEKFRVRSWR